MLTVNAYHNCEYGVFAAGNSRFLIIRLLVKLCKGRLLQLRTASSGKGSMGWMAVVL